MEHSKQPDRRERHARTVLPAAVHERLRHLSVDLDRTLADLLVEGAILVCMYHGRGDGLPEPESPLSPDNESGGAR